MGAMCMLVCVFEGVHSCVAGWQCWWQSGEISPIHSPLAVVPPAAKSCLIPTESYIIIININQIIDPNVTDQSQCWNERSNNVIALRATSRFLNSNKDLVETAMGTVDKWLHNGTYSKKKNLGQHLYVYTEGS